MHGWCRARWLPFWIGNPVGKSVPGLLAFLKDKHMLLVLDSCEHLVEATAALTEELFNRTSGVSLLVTSRELLRAEGERATPVALGAAGAFVEADSAGCDRLSGRPAFRRARRRGISTSSG